MESDKKYWLRKLDGQRGFCQVIYSYEVIVWDGITWDTWGRGALKSVSFYIKCTQSRSTSTFKSNFLNSLIIHILIFIFISPREPKETFGYLMIATGHCSMWFRSPPNELCPGFGDWQMAQMHIHSHISAETSCTPIPIFQLQTSFSWEHAGHIFPAFLFSWTSITKSLEQDTEAPEERSGHLHIFKLVDLLDLRISEHL